MGVKCLDVRETISLPGLPDVRIRKFWDFLNSIVSASTVFTLCSDVTATRKARI